MTENMAALTHNIGLQHHTQNQQRHMSKHMSGVSATILHVADLSRRSRHDNMQLPRSNVHQPVHYNMGKPPPLVVVDAPTGLSYLES